MSLDSIPDEELIDPSDLLKYLRRGGNKRMWWEYLLSQLQAPGIAAKRAGAERLKELWMIDNSIKIPQPIMEAAKKASKFIKEH